MRLICSRRISELHYQINYVIPQVSNHINFNEICRITYGL